MRVTKAVKAEQLRRLSDVYKNEGTMLTYGSPFTLLVAVVLSAQCTDKRVNTITDRIFPRLNTPEKMGALSQAKLEKEIHDYRLKLSVGDTPDQVEEGLKKVIPMKDWSDAHHWLIWHGRRVCHARRPSCETCFMSNVCPSCSIKVEAWEPKK